MKKSKYVVAVFKIVKILDHNKKLCKYKFFQGLMSVQFVQPPVRTMRLNNEANNYVSTVSDPVRVQLVLNKNQATVFSTAEDADHCIHIYKTLRRTGLHYFSADSTMANGPGLKYVLQVINLHSKNSIIAVDDWALNLTHNLQNEAIPVAWSLAFNRGSFSTKMAHFKLDVIPYAVIPPKGLIVNSISSDATPRHFAKKINALRAGKINTASFPSSHKLRPSAVY